MQIYVLCNVMLCNVQTGNVCLLHCNPAGLLGVAAGKVHRFRDKIW